MIKRLLPILASVVCAFAFVSCSGGNYQTGDVGRAETQAEQNFSNRILRAINAERSQRGLRPLQAHRQLTEMSRAHSRFLIANGDQRAASVGSLGHKDYVFRSRRAVGLGFAGTSEIVMGGSTEGDRVSATIESWMKSKRHRDNILNKEMTHFGTGTSFRSDGQFNSVVMFGGEREKQIQHRVKF